MGLPRLHSERPSLILPQNEVHTPKAKMTSFHDSESTLAETSSTEKQFDIIATKVNATIQELNTIYTLIGYSETEISDRKGDIFQVIQETISSFQLNLQREKNNIQNECEWLRQQIRIILAMLDDTEGEKLLKVSSRGVVFDDEELFRKGCKDDILHQVNSFHGFYLSSPFNTGNNDDYSAQQQYEYMADKTPQLSLLQLKARLNTIFLEVLRAFIDGFQKLNDLTLVFWENVDTIGECWREHANVELLGSLPTKNEAEEFSELIEEFRDIMSTLNITGKADLMVGPKGNVSNDYAFIVSSPKKAASRDSDLDDNQDVQDAMSTLRNVNYKIVRNIRALKLTKVTLQVVTSLHEQVNWTENEMERRKQQMAQVIGQCLSLIDILSLSKQDVISIQKMRDINDKEKTSENYFDVETLRFIRENPREFGLMDHHIDFVTKLASSLQQLKDAKQKKWDFYSNACIQLWDKLGENRDFVQLFLDTNLTLTDMSLANLKMELNRLYIKRSEFIDTFIADAREEIRQYQDALLYSEAQRQKFKYHDLDASQQIGDKELVLKEHENEVEKLKLQYADREPVLKLYAQLKELQEDQQFLVELSKDSSRLLSKNSCKILLNEEKIRKKINKSMPKVIESLKQETIKYNNKQLSSGHRPMTMDDQDFFERILLIEAEQASQPKPKFGRNRPALPLKPRLSPKSRLGRVSPLKSRSPSKVAKDSRNVSPHRRKLSDSTKRALDTSYSSQPQQKVRTSEIARSMFDSPPKNFRNTSISQNLTRSTHLQPLNSPLAPGSVFSDSTMDFRDRSDNSTLYSMCTRVSPLRSETNARANFSPIKGFDPVQSALDGKENDQFQILPIRVHAGMDEKRLSTASLANSTIIGDEYKQWRDEKIRAMNRRI